jgi:hypothetical protein
VGRKTIYPVEGVSADHGRRAVGISGANLDFVPCGRGTVEALTQWCTSSVRVVGPLAHRLRFIVDSADKDALPVAREELKLLLEKPALEGIPLLVLGNKSDLPNKLSVDELIDALNLKAVSHREVSCYGISAKEETNLDAVLQWLIARANK